MDVDLIGERDVSSQHLPGATVAPRASASVLHRLFRITPGDAPAWLCSRHQCAGFDVLGAFESGALVLCVVIGKTSGLWCPLPVAIAAVILFAACIQQPFARRERFGRARGDAENAAGVGGLVSARRKPARTAMNSPELLLHWLRPKQDERVWNLIHRSW